MKNLLLVLLPFVLLSCSEHANVTCHSKFGLDYKYVQMPEKVAKRISDRYAKNDVGTIVATGKDGYKYLIIPCSDIDKKYRILFWKDEILPDRYYDNIKDYVEIKYIINK